ncbi:hypothetical protein I204_03653 [Kwoniella mangroviensis CBS 8886]|nr:hypothetical protein I204_03653 [Kwoniella mangroviensis CBS 8886]
MYELISQTDQSQKIKLPSRLAKTLSSVQTRTSHDLDSLGGDERSIKSWKHFQDLKSKAALHNWKYSHKGDDRTPLGKSITSVPGIHRRPISDATRTAGRSDKSRIDQIDRFVSDSNSTDTVDDKQWWIMDQSLRSKYGYGKHGMKVDKEDQLRSKRSWNGIESSGNYLDNLNKTYCTDSSTNSSPGDSDTSTARTPLISASA